VAGEVTLRPRQSRKIDVTASAADVVDGVLTLVFSVQPQTTRVEQSPDTVCGTSTESSDLTAQVDVTDLGVVVTGQETKPTTVAAFFPTTTPRVTVVVPSTGDAPSLEAGLAAVAAVAYRYADADVTLATEPPTDHLLGERIIRIRPGTGAASVTVDPKAAVPTLVVSGGADTLGTAAEALGSDALLLANGSKSTGLSASPAEIEPPVNLAGFGASRLTLSGLGTSSAFVGVRQSDFGAPVSSVTFHLQGTHSAIPEGMSALLNVYWNEFLIGSENLNTGTDLSLDVTVPSSLMQGANGLRIETSVGASQSCDYALVPFTLTIDGARSTVTATTGDGVIRGFQRFPQVLDGYLPVALRGAGADRVANAELAAKVVAALQHASTTRLMVSLQDPDVLLHGTQSGLLCGATGADTDAVKARLRFYGMQLLYGTKQQATVGTDQPYAALQAVHQDGRDLLLLGGWSPGDGDTAALGQAAVDYVQKQGWAGLSDDLLISNAALPPFTLPSTAIYPQTVVLKEESHRIGWIWIGLGALVVLVGIRWGVTRWRRRRIARYVDAQQSQEQDDEDEAPRERGTQKRSGSNPPDIWA
jgi:hypothetical protein